MSTIPLRSALVLSLAALGCARVPPEPSPADTLMFAFEARTTAGEVRVVPALALHDPLDVNLNSYVGPALPPHRQRIRHKRTRQVRRLPRHLGLALPGEVNGLLGTAWEGQFRGTSLPTGAESRLSDALTGRRPDIHATLSNAAREVGGQATLFSWVRHLAAEPLSLRGFPGEVVETEIGPVVLDHEDEPFLVSAEIGMALVTEDGDVVLRYQDTYQALLSDDTDEAAAGRALARALAEEIAPVWAIEPSWKQPRVAVR